MADFELERVIAAGECDSDRAAGELAARREARPRIRGIDPQTRLDAHHGGTG